MKIVLQCNLWWVRGAGEGTCHSSLAVILSAAKNLSSPDDLCQLHRVMRGPLAALASCRDRGRMSGGAGALCLSSSQNDALDFMAPTDRTRTRDRHKAPTSPHHPPPVPTDGNRRVARYIKTVFSVSVSPSRAYRVPPFASPAGRPGRPGRGRLARSASGLCRAIRCWQLRR